METQIYHRAKIYLIFKKSSKRNKNPARYYNVINLKFQHKPKYHISKSSYKKIVLFHRGQNPISYYTL